jgi:hypothetical protein
MILSGDDLADGELTSLPFGHRRIGNDDLEQDSCSTNDSVGSTTLFGCGVGIEVEMRDIGPEAFVSHDASPPFKVLVE